MSGAALPVNRLRSLVRTGSSGADGDAPQRPQRCELCGEPLPEQHRHLLELSGRQLDCVCRACAVLFDSTETATGRYRAVPYLRRRLPEPPVDDVVWAALQVPVRLAFFVRHAPVEPADADETVTAYYPSPLGMVGADVEPEAWARVGQAPPEPDVTALLIRRDPAEQWLLGIDECYRLTARVRQSWQGMTGGDEVWLEIERFFAELRDGADQRSR